jgi:TolB protein
MAWSYDSRHLLVHRGLEHMLVDAASDNALLNLNEDAAVYRVPAWTPSETTYTVARRVSRTDALLIERDALEGDAQQGRVVTAVQYNPAYLWSPDGGNLALASTGGIMLFNGSEMAIYRDLTISPRNDAALPVRIAGNVLAFFWSPDGQKLAYVSPGNRAGVLRWNVYDASAQEAWPVADFVPSADQVTLFQFFDQYAYSHSPWSPDSEALVFSGVLDTDAVTASSRALQSIPNINVVRADGLSSISIAEGILAVWSPR